MMILSQNPSTETGIIRAAMITSRARAGMLEELEECEDEGTDEDDFDEMEAPHLN